MDYDTFPRNSISDEINKCKNNKKRRGAVKDKKIVLQLEKHLQLTFSESPSWVFWIPGSTRAAFCADKESRVPLPDTKRYSRDLQVESALATVYVYVCIYRYPGNVCVHISKADSILDSCVKAKCIFTFLHLHNFFFNILLLFSIHTNKRNNDNNHREKIFNTAISSYVDKNRIIF